MSENTISGDGHESFPSPRRLEPDAHGQAGLLLAESILYTLIEAKVLTSRQAIEAVRTAEEVKVDVAEESGESRGRMQQSLHLLAAIERSLATDETDAANEP